MDYQPREYQKIATQLILDKPSVALWLDMGLGKTVSTLTALETLIFDYALVEKALIVAPLKVAESTWPDEIAKWDHLKDMRYSLVLGNEEQRKEALEKEAELYIINVDNLVWLVEYLGKKWPFDCLVIDEASAFKNPKTKRFKALKKVRKYISRVIELTGTPSPNGYLDLWSQIYLLDQGERLGRTMTSYRDFYFYPAKTGRSPTGQHIVYQYDLVPGVKYKIQKRLEDICYSMRIDDWMDLPKKMENTMLVDLPPEAQAQYHKLERDLILQIKNTPIVAKTAATLLNKLLQMANGAVYDEKGEAVCCHDAKLEALDRVVGESSSVLVFYAFKHDLERLKERYPQARELKRAEDLADWNAGEIQVLLAHPASSGHGLNLQGGGHVICWYGLTWSLELYQQANARLYRQGQMHPVIIHHIVSRGTVDELVLEALGKKEVSQERLLKALQVKYAEK